MNTDLFDDLEADLRATLHAVVPHLLDESPGHTKAHGVVAPSFVRTTAGPAHIVRRWARVGTMAAALVLMLGAGAAVLTFGRHDPGASSTPSGASDASASNVDCSQGVCVGFDRLPLAPGVGNVFVGPADLGTPRFERELYDRLTRCVELDATFTECTKVEGMAGVNVVSYPAGVADTTATIDIGTVFTDVTAEQYASISSTPGPRVVLRGHDAVPFDTKEGNRVVVWEEEPGVLVWVRVPATRAESLLPIAEGVRLNPDPPTTIPNVVQVKIVGATATPPASVRTEPAWNAHDNNGRGLLVGTAGTTECVGYEFIATCGQAIDDRTFVSTARASDGATPLTVVAGSTPPNVTSVLVTLADGHGLIASTVTFAQYSSRFYDIEIADAQVSTIEWLDANGQTVATMARSTATTASPVTTLPPVSSPPATVGTNTGCSLYEVVKGDTPAAVAQRFGVTLDALRQANTDIPNFDAFYLGLRIRVPLPADSPLCTPTT